MTTAKEVNNLTNSFKLEKEGLKAFILIYHTLRTGIVKDIPQHFDKAGLLEFFGSVPFAHVAIDHSHSKQPVRRGFPLFKRCEW